MVSLAPKNFYGSKPDVEDADEFIDEVEQYVISGHGNLSSEEMATKQDIIEQDLIRVFRHHLEGQARRWYYTTPKELRRSWPNLRSFFLATFPSRALEMDEYKKGLRREFGSLEQLPNESVSDYVYRWEVLAKQIQCLKAGDSDPDFLIGQACAGIKDMELSQHILSIAGGSEEIPFSRLRRFSNLIEAKKVGMEGRGIHLKLNKPQKPSRVSTVDCASSLRVVGSNTFG